MKEKIQNHPRLYVGITKQEKKYCLDYYDNQYNGRGGLVVKSTSIPFDKNIKNKSDSEILYELNKIQFDLLENLIRKQQKVVEIYLNKGKKDQLRVVSSSLELLFEYQNKFLRWFSDNEILQ